MKSIFYFLTILFLSLLISCSDEPPTSVELETLSKKPIKDPPTAEQLVLLDADNQIVAASMEGRGNKQKGVIRVWTYEGSSYSKTWEKSGDGSYGVSAIGDVDNDGNDELVVVYTFKTGGGRNEETHSEIQVFENGETEPSRTSDYLDDDGVDAYTYMRLGDANNDGTVEIMLAHMNHLSVHKDNGTEVTMLWKSESLAAEDPLGIDAGDPDNDGLNEIIYPSLGTGRFGVYEYLGNNVWGNKVYSEPISFCGLDRVFVADVDGDGNNEVYGGGCHQKLTIWEFVGGSYVIDFESAELGGFTQGVAAGDFDNDGSIEIAVGTLVSVNKIFVFKYDETTETYTNVFEEPISGFGPGDMVAGDSDNDGVDEIIVATNEGLLVYDYMDGYSQTYSDPGKIFTVGVK